jgi:hypothetical protein
MDTTPSTRPLLRVALGLALASTLSACPYNVPDDPDVPTEQGDATPIARDAACKLTGSLELTLGEGNGYASFRPLAAGEGPSLHHGPQGGTHLEFGVRIANPATDFPGLQVRLFAERCGDAGCERMWTYRELVLHPERFLPQDNGAVAVSGFLVFVNEWPTDTRRRITLEATDRCGRTGSTTLEVAPGA